MVKLGIISDTHYKKEDNKSDYSGLMTHLNKIFIDVDEIIHAGDIYEEWFLMELEKIALTRAVKSKNDRIPNLEKFIKFKIGAYHVGVIHEPPQDMKTFFEQEKLNILIHGHSHYPLIKTTKYETLILNPGSPTSPSTPPQKKGFMKLAARPTVLILNIDEEDILSTYIVTLKTKIN